MKKTRSHWSVPTIAYEGPGATNALAFRHYNPDELIDGKTMSAHMRFSIAYWHSFRGTGSDPFGPGTILRPWEKGTDAVSIAKVRMDAAFEFFQKIRAPFWYDTSVTLEKTEEFSKKVLTIPLYVGLSKKELNTICKALQQFYGTKIN